VIRPRPLSSDARSRRAVLNEIGGLASVVSTELISELDADQRRPVAWFALGDRPQDERKA
jgi:hypothetical protein